MNEYEQTSREPNHERVAEALETIVQVFVGEDLESLRHSVQTSESELSRRIDAVREESTTRLDDSTGDLAGRIDSLSADLSAAEKSHGEALAGLEDRTDRIVAELKKQLETTLTQVESRIETARTGLEAQLEAADRSFKEHLDALARNLATVQLGLQQQMETSERLSAVLNNLASIFSGQVAAAVAAPGEAELSDAEEKRELESALDKVFPAGS